MYVDIIEGTVPHSIQSFDYFTIAAGESKIMTLSIPAKYNGIVQIESEKELEIDLGNLDVTIIRDNFLVDEKWHTINFEVFQHEEEGLYEITITNTHDESVSVQISCRNGSCYSDLN